MVYPQEKQYLVERLGKLVRMMNALEGESSSSLIVYPSRHVVVRSREGTTIGKAYKDPGRWENERENLQRFSEINKEGSSLLEGILGKEITYIGLPERDQRLDLGSIHVKSQNGLPISIFSAVPGDLLYDKTLNHTATLEDYISAAVQIARIQEEGKLHRDKFGLEDVVRRRESSTTYFLERFQNVFLKQLIDYGKVQVLPWLQEYMTNDWETLVAKNLVTAHRYGHTGYYFDGNPKHHILESDKKSIVSFDFEYKMYTPALLGLASLLSFGLTNKDGQQYLSKEEQEKILDRYLLERAFVNALRDGARDKVEEIVSYIKERSAAYNFDLSGQNSGEFYKFLGYGSRNIGHEIREEFLEAWPYALLDRHAAWLGHKARYRDVAGFLLEECLFKEEGIKFEHEDTVRQNTIEQRQHLDQIITILQELQGVSTKNGRNVQYATKRLQDRFQELAQNPYFNPK